MVRKEIIHKKKYESEWNIAKQWLMEHFPVVVLVQGGGMVQKREGVLLTDGLGLHSQKL